MVKANQRSRALPYLRDAIAKFQNAPDRKISEWFWAAGIIGESLMVLGQYEEAETYLQECYNAYMPGPKCGNPLRGPGLVEVCDRLESLYKVWGKSERMAQYR